MSACLPTAAFTVVPAKSGRIAMAGEVSVGVFRLPTDPLYFFTLTLGNIVPGSRYRVTRRDTGEELATGVAASDTEVIPVVPAYSAGMLMDITVRHASPPGPYYRIFDTAAVAHRAGAFAYILQQLDE